LRYSPVQSQHAWAPEEKKNEKKMEMERKGRGNQERKRKKVGSKTKRPTISHHSKEKLSRTKQQMQQEQPKRSKQQNASQENQSKKKRLKHSKTIKTRHDKRTWCGEMKHASTDTLFPSTNQGNSKPDEQSEGQLKNKWSTNIVRQGKATQQEPIRPKQPQATRRVSRTPWTINHGMTEQHDTKRSDTRETSVESQWKFLPQRTTKPKWEKPRSTQTQTTDQHAITRQCTATQQEATQQERAYENRNNNTSTESMRWTKHIRINEHDCDVEIPLFYQARSSAKVVFFWESRSYILGEFSMFSLSVFLEVSSSPWDILSRGGKERHTSLYIFHDCLVGYRTSTGSERFGKTSLKK
jgi:hypothetical protein